MSVAQAKSMAMDSVGSMRYEKIEYFWISGLDGITIMHPIDKKLVGQSMLTVKDSHGKIFMNEIISQAKSDGGGFVKYYWHKPGETKPSPKITYSKYYNKWNWIVSSGIYIDDVDSEVNTMFLAIAIAGLIIAAFALLASWFISRAIANPIHNIITGLNRNSDRNNFV